MLRTSIIPTFLGLSLAVNSFPLDHSSDTSLSTSDAVTPISHLQTRSPAPEGWMSLNTFGIMMRLDQRDVTPPCVGVACLVHMAAVQNSSQTSSASPAVAIRSRDLYKRDAMISANPSTGDFVYTAVDSLATISGTNLEVRSPIADDIPAKSGLLSYDNEDPDNDFVDDDDYIEDDYEDAESQLDPASLTKRAKKTSSKCGDKCRMAKKKVVKTAEKGKKKTGTIAKVATAVKDIMKGATIRTTITWYTGIDLHNPFCDRKSRWTPTDEALIVAVTEKWSLRPHCGEFMEISTTDAAKGKENRKVVARVVDLCGGCKAEIAHADLSKAAFLKLYDLDVGLVTNLKMRLVSAPKEWSDKLYGPKDL